MNDVEQPESAVAKGIVSDEGKSRDFETDNKDIERAGAALRGWFWLMVILFVVVVAVVVGLALLGPVIGNIFHNLVNVI